jgi:Tfp pilus assembly protein PilO
MFKKLNLDEKKKSIIIAAGITLLTFFISLNIIRLHAFKRNAAKQAVKDQSQKIALRRDIEKIETMQKEYAAFFYNNLSQQALRSLISDLAHKTGVSIVSIKTAGREIIGNIIKESLDLSLNCNYSQFGTFINEIENLENITRVESFSIEPVSDFGNQANISGQIQEDPMESDTRASVLMVVAGYSLKG